MIIVPTYLGQSGIHGLGVFSRNFIPKGTKVWEFNAIFDIVIKAADYEALPAYIKDDVDVHCYPFEDDGQRYYFYEATEGKYMNHANEPNLDFTQDGLGWALRDIHPNEEMTCDYRHFMGDVSHIEYL